MSEAVYPLKIPIVNSLPPPSNNTHRLVVYNNNIYFSNGTTWINLGAAGGGGGSGVSSLNNLTGALTLAGSSNISVQSSYDTITVDTVQNISQTSSPKFNSVDVSSIRIGEIDLSGYDLSFMSELSYTLNIPLYNLLALEPNNFITINDFADFNSYKHQRAEAVTGFQGYPSIDNIARILPGYTGTSYVLTSKDGVNYKKIATGTTFYLDVIKINNGYMFLHTSGSTTSYIQKSYDGVNWSFLSPPENKPPYYSIDGKYMVCAGTNGWVFSNNYGESFTTLSLSFTPTHCRMTPNGKYICLVNFAEKKLAYTTNYGESWSTITISDLPDNGFNYKDFTIDYFNPRYIYFLMYFAGGINAFRLYKLTDFSTLTLEVPNVSFPVSNYYISPIYVFGKYIYFMTESYSSSIGYRVNFCVSKNGGQSFEWFTYNEVTRFSDYSNRDAKTFRMYTPSFMSHGVNFIDGYYSFTHYRRIVKNTPASVTCSVNADTIYLHSENRGFPPRTTVVTHCDNRGRLDLEMRHVHYGCPRDFYGGPYVPYALTAAAPTTLTLTAGRTYIIPFSLSAHCRLNELYINVTTAAAGNHQIGIYSSYMDENEQIEHAPYRLLISTTFDTGTTGTKSFFVSTTGVPPIVLYSGRIYWLAWYAPSAATVRAIAGTALYPLSISTSSPTAFVTSYYTTDYTSLPATMSGMLTNATSASAFPMVIMGLSSGTYLVRLKKSMLDYILYYQNPG